MTLLPCISASGMNLTRPDTTCMCSPKDKRGAVRNSAHHVMPAPNHNYNLSSTLWCLVSLLKSRKGVSRRAYLSGCWLPHINLLHVQGVSIRVAPGALDQPNLGMRAHTQQSQVRQQ
jgi:hypothetical protein